jgi:hypothetical protein
MSSINQSIPAIESQQIFFTKITRNKLNEFLNRVTTGFLQDQIVNTLKNIKPKIRISENCMDVYINFYDMNTRKIGHLTFHLNKSSSNINNKYLRRGRLHAVNNRNTKYYTLRVNDKNELFQLSINSPLKMKNDLQECINITINILNDYTNKYSMYYLGKNITKNKKMDNKCLETIAGEKEQKRYRETRRKQSNSIQIPKVPNKSPWIKSQKL